MTNQVSASNMISSQDEMTELADLTLTAGLTIDQWKVTYKENMEVDKLKYFIKQWKNSYLDSYSEDESVIKYSFRDVQKKSGIVESYIVIIPKNSNYKPELIVVISGQKWNKNIEIEYKQLQKTIFQQYFTKDAVKFTCLSTASSDTMNSVYLVELFKEKLELQYMTTQIDNVEESMNKKMIYGYTHLWKQKLNILGKPVNVNIAITNTENKETKVTVGTPILITEY